MTTEELITWFHNEFWEQYRELIKTPFVTKHKIGSKGEALKKMLQMKPSEALRARILSAIIEQRKHRKLMFEQCGSMQKYLEITKFDKFYCTRMCSTWINQMGWEDEIPQLDSVAISHDVLFGSDRCSNDDCVFPIHGPGYTLCSQCLSRTNKHNEELKNKLREMGLGKSKDESVHDYAMRCKHVALKTLRGMKHGL